MFEDTQPIDYSNYLPVEPPVQSATVQMANTRQTEEVKAAIFMAKQFPRDQQASFNRIIQSCKRKKLAEEAEYEFPKGGSKISGPSIRLAEVVAQAWGNIDYGLIELEQRHGESKVMAYAWDMETNTRRQMTFTARHERKAKGKIQKLEESRDIYEVVANLGSRRMRACILGVIPGDIIDAALEQCRKTLKDSYKEPLVDRVRNAFQQFQEKYGVTKEMIEEYIGCSQESFTENDFLRIGNVWKSLRDGMAKREDYFNFSVPTHQVSKTEEEFKQLQHKQTGGDQDAPAEQSELPLG
ncbi:hypothetical protein ERICIV_00862 [Paenibacillus larvae subsp. larvae]|uniref:Uncharacterized protein n=2 Tax=Paenibacillus larvae TaxID=1464 RepID=A0A2L1U2H2_9BACL|nr:hypothetical protein [Paenibacillus larvae]AQT85666.1 hypothetical protein B1222_16655 [Paenibacillus larvae subsp. pulvifaciens]AVF25066.1 hypothetical protein ERICIII_00859 [Paenibacillus larvae subsp. larvae]AVF27116.1 hypothetical protein ERICIII_02989 [Paenibacillus larvae subsp. larvae]AVF29830.1 hypothetical protein ERICIV_00862 [Paenibacillus larvae subsp. larvae]MBH0344331.1 hypothetical protein [Paenibacillus larvae]